MFKHRESNGRTEGGSRRSPRLCSEPKVRRKTDSLYSHQSTSHLIYTYIARTNIENLALHQKINTLVSMPKNRGNFMHFYTSILFLVWILPPRPILNEFFFFDFKSYT